MKITTRFILTLSFFLLILIGMAVSLILTNHQVERLDQQDMIAHRIERGTDELSFLTGDYLMYGESQQRARWEASFASFSEDVSRLEVQDPELQAIVAQIEADRARLWAVFEDVAGTLDRYAQLPDTGPDPAFTQLSWSRMEVQVQAVAFETSLLSQKLGDQADQLKQLNLVLMLSLIGIFGLSLLSNYYLIYQRTLRSIAGLHTGTQIIGSGNLDYTIPVKRMDEIGQLSLAFNKMTASLKEVTASKADLEREIAERQKVESRLQAVMVSSPDPIYLKDRNSRLLLANPATFAVIGKPAEAVLGKTDAEFYDDPATGRAILENDRRIIDSGRMEVVEESVSDEEGTRVFLSTKAPYCDPDGQVIGLVGVARDITERKRAEEALGESEERLRITLSSIGDAVLTTDAHGIATYLNPVAERLTGWPSLEAAGLPLEQVLPLINEITHQPAENPVVRVLQTGQVVGLSNHTALVARDGRLIPIEDSAAPIRDAAGCPVGVVLVFHDVTEKRSKELELVRLNRTLRALGHSSQAMLHLDDEADYLDAVCRIITEDCGHAMVWIGYAEEDAMKSVRPVAYAGFEAGYLDTLEITWADTERGRGPTGTAIHTGQVSLCRNMLTDPQFAPWRDEGLKRGYAASIVLPLIAGGKTFGALTIYSREPDPFSADEIVLLTEIANDLANAITTIRSRTAQEQAKILQLENEQNRARVEVQHRLIEQREKERLQIARDLHDGPVQELTAATFTLRGLIMDGSTPEATQQLEEVQETIQKQIHELRDFAGELRPPTLAKFGLGKAIYSHLETFRQKHPELDISFEEEQAGDLIPEDKRLALFRIYQEVLINITKHARATQVQVTIRDRKTPEQAVLEIRDNGVGFVVPKDWLELARHGHLGLVGIRERAEAVGGKLEITSQPGNGTKIQVSVPLRAV